MTAAVCPSLQASLDEVTPVDLAVNLSLREDVLITKLLGRRMCSSCGGNFNVANIQIPATGTAPQIVMPPLSPPEACLDKMSVRADDTEDVVRSRLDIYYKEVSRWHTGWPVVRRARIDCHCGNQRCSSALEGFGRSSRCLCSSWLAEQTCGGFLPCQKPAPGV